MIFKHKWKKLLKSDLKFDKKKGCRNFVGSQVQVLPMADFLPMWSKYSNSDKKKRQTTAELEKNGYKK